MATYMVQFSYSVDAWKRLIKNPEDRSKPLAASLNQLGAKLLGLYYCFGDYDGVAMIEAPDDVTAASGVLAAVSGGDISTIKTTKLFSIEDGMAMMKKASSVV